MNGDGGMARRYHWHSEGLGSFVEAPHAAIEGRSTGNIVNLTDARADRARTAQVAMLRDEGPDAIVRELAALQPKRACADQVTPQLTLPHLVMPSHHDVRPKDVMARRLHGALAAAADRGPSDFSELLLVPGIGARTVRSLAMVAEVLHGAPCRFSDPARFSLAHGGKDRQPFAVPTKVYDQTIAVLRSAVDRAKLGQEDRLAAIARLDGESRRLEQSATGPTLVEYVAEERRRSPEYGGRSVFGWERPDGGCEKRQRGEIPTSVGYTSSTAALWPRVESRGAWSLALPQPRTWRSTPAASRRAAKSGLRRTDAQPEDSVDGSTSGAE
jgi:hypothetical protein